MILYIYIYIYIKDADTEQEKILRCFERTFSTYLIEDEDAIKLSTEITGAEGALEQKRNTMELGNTLRDIT